MVQNRGLESEYKADFKAQVDTEVGMTKGKKEKQRKKEGRERDRKEFQMGTCTLGRELGRRKSFCTLGNPLTGGVRGKLQNLRGEHSKPGALKANWRKFTIEIALVGTSQPRSSSHSHLPAFE